MFKDRETGSALVPHDGHDSGRVTTSAPIDAELLRAAEAKGKYVAIYIIWVLGETGFMIGTTRSPREMPTQAERFNKKPIDFALLWCPSQEVADRILADVRAEIKPFFAHGTWYDKIKAIDGIKKVESVAEQRRVRLMTPIERERRLQEAVTYAMAERKQLDDSREKRPVLPAPDLTKVVPFPTTKKG
jgi:hypothetical protein